MQRDNTSEFIEINYHLSRGSDSWKADALQAHRFNMVYNILPKYGICAA